MMLMIGALAVAVTCERARADIVFLVDSSRSICGSDATCSNWQTVLNFVNSVVNQLNIGSDNTRVGFVRYSSMGATANSFYLNSHSSRSAVTSAVSGVSYVTGGSVVGSLINAFQVARTQQFVSNRGDRTGVANIIILLMNGGVTVTSNAVSLQSFITSTFYLPCNLPCAASLAGVPPGGLGLSGLVHEKAHPSISIRTVEGGMGNGSLPVGPGAKLQLSVWRINFPETERVLLAAFLFCIS